MLSLAIPLDFTERQRDQFIWPLYVANKTQLLIFPNRNIGDRPELGSLLICVILDKYKFPTLLNVENKTYCNMHLKKSLEGYTTKG